MPSENGPKEKKIEFFTQKIPSNLPLQHVHI